MTNQRDAATIWKDIVKCSNQLSAAQQEHKPLIDPAQARLDPNKPGNVPVLDLEQYRESRTKCDNLLKTLEELEKEYLAASK